MNVAAYVRVSSKSQDTAMQRSAIERASITRGDVVTAWYEEKRSGKTLKRIELDRLRQDARSGLFKKLYVYRLDRLTRSGIRDTLEVVEAFRSYGVELVSISDGFDLNGPFAEVIIAVMAWAAKVERLAIDERISSTREHFAAEGKAWGRPQRLTDEDRAKVLALKSEGRSIRQIAAAMRCPRATIARALRPRAA